MLQSELKKEQHDIPDKIPGDPGHIKVSPDYKVTRTEGGISYTGWCVGASDVVLVMAPAGKIAGRVTDSAGNSIANATIQVEFDLAGRFGNVAYPSLYFWQTSTSADADGYYIVGFLPPLWDKCRYQLSFGAEGFVSQRESVTSKGPLDEMTVDFRLLQAGSTVRGILKDNYGALLDNRAVFATVDGRRYSSCSTRTNDDGSFELKGCPVVQGLGVGAELSYNLYATGTPKDDGFEYYPDLAVDVEYEPGQNEYDVEMIAILPELTIEVDVVDSTGHPLSWYPVEIRAGGKISTQWKRDRRFYAITDETGFCRLENVPDIEGLRIILSGEYYTTSYQHLPKHQRDEIQQFSKTYINKYKRTYIPIEIVPGEKNYYVRAVILTSQQHENGMNPW